MRSTLLQIHVVYRWLIMVVLLFCGIPLITAQSFTAGDTLKYTVLAERVNDNTNVIRITPLNETSLFWAIQQGLVLRRYTITENGAHLSNSEIINSKMDFPLTAQSQSWFQGKASDGEIWPTLNDCLFAPDFNGEGNLALSYQNRHGYSMFATSQGFEYGEAQGLAFKDEEGSKGNSYVYFVVSNLSGDQIFDLYNLYGFQNPEEVFQDQWLDFFKDNQRLFSVNANLWSFFGYSGDNTVEENEIFVPIQADQPTGTLDYYTANVNVSTNSIKKHASSYRIERLIGTSTQWSSVLENQSVYANTHRHTEELSQNNVEYKFRVTALYNFYARWLTSNGAPSEPVVLKPNVKAYLAGERPFQLAVKYKNVKGNLQLRWVPMNYETWELGNKNGYKLERFLLGTDGFPIQSSKVTTVLPVKPESEFILIDSIVTQAIYHPEDFKVVQYDNPAINAQRTEENKNERMGIALFRADGDISVANASGLAYQERQLDADKNYLYIISINNLSTAYQKLLMPASVKVNTDNWRSGGDPTPMMTLTGSGGDKSFELRWTLPEGDLHYTGFYILRKRKNTSEPFVRMNPFPFVYNLESATRELLYSGEIPENKVPYEFKVQGVTPFGETLDATNIIEVSGYPPALESRPFINDVVEETKGSLTLKWTFPIDDLPKVKSFEIWRCKTRDGQFELLADNIPPSVMSFVDPKPLITNYYVVTANDENDYELPSVSRMAYPSDEIPPMRPHDVVGVSDENGNVTLTWAPNLEEDLKGYIVYYSNNEDGEYVPLTGEAITATTYTHSANIESLTEISNYKIAAIDYRDNLSKFSLACKVKLPDINPPGEAVIVSLSSVATGVKVEFRPSSSLDVSIHEIQRKADYEVYWETVKTLPKKPNDSIFIDTTGRAFVEYDYRIVAIDDDNLSSNSTPIRVKNLKNGIRLSVSNPYVFRDREALKALAIPNNSTTSDFCYMKVYWEYPEFANIADFLIYRSYKGSPFILIKRVTYEEALFSGTINVSKTSELGNGQSVGNDVILGRPKELNPYIPPVNPPSGKNPPLAIKPIRAFLACDADITTTLQADKNPNVFKYEIMVRFLDGTSSRLSAPISVK